MIGPVSTTGRTMMASLQQAIQKGMPPDQAIQYVKSMATQGVAPLADLYAMMNQFQRLKQQPVQPPQTPPTIRDQLNMAEQQQAMMQQGVASLPAPAMEQAQFAGGGIVAFSTGGRPDSSNQEELIDYYENIDPLRASPEDREILRILKRHPTVRTEEEKTRLYDVGIKQVNVNNKEYVPNRPQYTRTPADKRTRDFKLPSNFGFEGIIEPEPFGITIPTEQAAPAGLPAALPRRPAGPAARSGQAVAPAARPGQAVAPAAPSITQPAQKTPTIDELREARMKSRQEYKERERIGSAREEMRSFLSEENNKLAEQFGRDKMLAFAEAGFKMAAAASRPGATFLGALSEGAISGTQALRGLQKEMDANRRGLRESMLKLREADELEKMGDYDKAATEAQQALTDIRRREEFDQQLAVDMEKIKVQREGLDVQMRGQNLDFEGRKIAAAASLARGAGSGSSSGTLGLLRMKVDGLDMDYKDQQDIANDVTRSPTERAQARAKMGMIRKERDELVAGGTLSGASGGMENPYSGFSATLVEE